MVVTIQPGEMEFTTPAPLSLPNLSGYEPGEEMKLWSINPITGDFDQVGRGRISDDGSTVETIEGGIRNSSWHFFTAPPPEPIDPDENEKNKDDKCKKCNASGAASSSVEFHSGAIIETHDLVTYQSNGENRGVALTYDSLRADPRPIVHLGLDRLRGNEGFLYSKLRFKQDGFEYQVPGRIFNFTRGMLSVGSGGSNSPIITNPDEILFSTDTGEHVWSIPRGDTSANAAITIIYIN